MTPGGQHVDVAGIKRHGKPLSNLQAESMLQVTGNQELKIDRPSNDPEQVEPQIGQPHQLT